MCHIRESDFEDVYIVKGQSYDGVEYKIDTKKWRALRRVALLCDATRRIVNEPLHVCLRVKHERFCISTV